MRAAPPDPILPGERKVRFVFGALFGAFVGLLYGLRDIRATPLSLISFAILGAALCGVVAALWGDRFWRSLPSWLP